MTTVNRRLTFPFADDLMLAWSLGRGEIVRNAFRCAEFSDLCPAIECQFQAWDGPDFSPLKVAPRTSVTAAILGVAALPDTLTDLRPADIEVRPIPAEGEAVDKPAWIAFKKRLQGAAKSAGFDNQTAAGITGAFCEMVDNAQIHSESSHTMLAGYQWNFGKVTYCVADRGIGVLSSLRKCNYYKDIEDYGTALETAIRDGESRFRDQGGRGFGYRQVFKSLAGLNGLVRIRSGDFVVELEGRELSHICATVAQRSFLQGLIVSVICRSK